MEVAEKYLKAMKPNIAGWEAAREPLPVLAQPAHLHRRGPGNTKSQSDRGRGIREERNT